MRRILIAMALFALAALSINAETTQINQPSDDYFNTFSPLFYYHLDENTGTSIVDSSSAGNDGTLDDVTTWETDGLSNSMINFTNGTSASIQASDNSGLNGGGLSSYTIGTWVKAKNGSSSRIIHTETADGKFYLAWNLSGTNEVILRQDCGAAWASSPSKVIDPDKWYWVVGTWNGSHINIYVNGTKIGAGTACAGMDGTGNSRMDIGSEADSSSYFHGEIDEVVYLSTNLSSSKISEMYSDYTYNIAISYLNITPFPAYGNSTLQGVINATNTDNKNMTFECEWYIDGSLNQSYNSRQYLREDADSTAVSITYGSGTINGYLYVNYTKPSNATRLNSSWRVKYGYDGTNPYDLNLTLPEACWSAYDDLLRLRISSYQISSGGYESSSRPFCWDGSSWNPIGTDSNTSGISGGSGNNHPDYLYDQDYSTYSIAVTFGYWTQAAQTPGLYRAIYEESMTFFIEAESGEEIPVDSFSSQSKNQNVTLSCRAFDGTTYSAYSNVSINISNSIPTISSVTLPATYLGETINSSWTFSDSDNDSDTSYYRWYLNGALQSYGQYGGSKLNFTGYSAVSDNVTLSILGNDGQDNATSWVNASIIISNVSVNMTINDNPMLNQTITRNGSATFYLYLEQSYSVLLNYTASSDGASATTVRDISINETTFNLTDNRYLRIDLNSTNITGSDSFNISLYRNWDGIYFNFTVNLTVVNSSAILSLAPTTLWTANMYSDSSTSYSMNITNSGNHTATNCTFIASDSADSFLSHNSGFSLDVNSTRSYSLSFTRPSVGIYSGSITAVCYNATDSGETVSSTTSIPYLIVSSSRPVTVVSGGGGGGASGIDESDVKGIIRDETKGFVAYAYPGYEHIIPYLPTKDFTKEVIVKALEGNVNATVYISETLSGFMSGKLCDLRTLECSDSMVLQEDEEIYLSVSADLTRDSFKTDFLDDGVVKGYVLVLSNNQAGPEQYNITIRKSKLFDKSKELSLFLSAELGKDVTQKSAYFLITISTITILSAIAFVLLRSGGIV